MVNEASYEALKIIEGEEEMRNFIRMILVGVMVLGIGTVAVSCNNDTGGQDEDPGPTVDPKFQGDWVFEGQSQDYDNIYYTITDTKFIMHSIYVSSGIRHEGDAFSVDDTLYVQSYDAKLDNFSVSNIEHASILKADYIDGKIVFRNKADYIERMNSNDASVGENCTLIRKE